MKYYIAVIFCFLFFLECIVCLAQTQARCPSVRLQNGRVRTRARGRIVRFACFEGFTLVGNKYSTCVRGQWDTPLPVCVNAECQLPPTPEHALMASKYNGAILIYFCEPGYALIGPSEIYCDGRQWNGTAPDCRDTSAAVPTKCDFEKPDLCWWEQDPQHDFDWRRHNFETPSSHIGTGPTYDHTLGPGNDGYYLYVEASGRLVNDTARIMSPLYNASLTQNGCFSFWYHMYGATMGSLRIYFKEEKNATSRLMFTKDGNQGNQWLHGVFDLPRTNQSFQIIIEGVRGLSYVSDIAIDDVALLSGDECHVKRTETVSNTTASSETDQIELVNSLQSCRGRCSNSGMAETYHTVIPATAPDACICTIDCAEMSMCCPDFAEFCVLAFTEDAFATDMMKTEFVSKPTVAYKNVTKVVPTFPNTTVKTTTTPEPKKHTWITINPKDDIDPNTVPVNEVTKRPETSTKRTYTTTTTKKPETKKSDEIHPKETPFPTINGGTTSRLEESGSHMSIIDTVNETINERHRVGIPRYAIILISLLIGTAVTACAAYVVIRRKRTYKKGTNGSALSEDSDVRFLTSDEILDFTLARPNENDEL